MSISIEKMTDELSSLTVMQIIELKKSLEDRWGVKASSGVAMMSAAPVAAVATAEEQSSFSVIIKNPGEKKIDVIKVIREITGLGLKEAKDLSEKADGVIKADASKAEANDIKAKLEASGAKIELK